MVGVNDLANMAFTTFAQYLFLRFILHLQGANLCKSIFGPRARAFVESNQKKNWRNRARVKISRSRVPPNASRAANSYKCLFIFHHKEGGTFFQAGG